MTVQIRPATIADVDTIAVFNCRLALETEDHRLDLAVVRSGVRRAIESDRGATYVLAAIEDQTVGQLMYTHEWSDWRDGMMWWIQSVYVASAFRGCGVFRSLLEHVQVAAEARSNVCMIRLYVEADNERALETYTRLGFKETPYRIYERTVRR